jgi:hypothetical protein
MPASNAVIVSCCKHMSSDDSDNFRGFFGDSRDISFTALSDDATDDDDDDDEDDDDDDGGRCMFFIYACMMRTVDGANNAKSIVSSMCFS